MLTVGTVVLGVEDVPRAAAFWCAALNLVPRDVVDGDFAVLVPGTGHGTSIALGRSATPVQKHPRVHLDLYSEDPAADIEHLLGLGATRVADWDLYPADPDFTVLADTEGNRFCVIDKS
ncbi:VOC family protein [Phytomonospora sp. NPDC050363]|uniref:VOC family protein n=1 Tax=Phytomonospora sp. NPDC050363 TaxID=3155642 RepID=UPI00340F6C6C